MLTDGLAGCCGWAACPGGRLPEEKPAAVFLGLAMFDQLSSFQSKGSTWQDLPPRFLRHGQSSWLLSSRWDEGDSIDGLCLQLWSNMRCVNVLDQGPFP